MVKFTKEYRHAIPGQIYKGIQACNTWSNLWKIETCNTWSNLQRNPGMQYIVKFTKKYKPVIPGLIY